MTVRERIQALNHWLATRIHGSYIRELDTMRELLNRDDSAYPGACDIEGCHRVARGNYETETTSLRLCYPCANAFKHGLVDDDIAFVTTPIEPDPTQAARPASSTRR